MTNPPVQLGDHGRSFAHNMRLVRHAREFHVTDVARAVTERGFKLTPDSVIRIEAGQRRASVDEACEIATVLGVPLTALVRPSHLRLVPDRPDRGHMLDGSAMRALC